MLEYRSKLNGKLFVKVNQKYTSLECSVCGNRDKANRPKQNYFKCVRCGYETNPDIQSSGTILKRGIRVVWGRDYPGGLKTQSLSLRNISFC